MEDSLASYSVTIHQFFEENVAFCYDKHVLTPGFSLGGLSKPLYLPQVCHK